MTSTSADLARSIREAMFGSTSRTERMSASASACSWVLSMSTTTSAVLGNGGSLRRGRDRLDQVADLRLVDLLGQVGLADDADALGAVDHRQAAYGVVLHRAQRLVDRVVGADRHG